MNDPLLHFNEVCVVFRCHVYTERSEALSAVPTVTLWKGCHSMTRRQLTVCDNWTLELLYPRPSPTVCPASTLHWDIDCKCQSHWTGNNGAYTVHFAVINKYKSCSLLCSFSGIIHIFLPSCFCACVCMCVCPLPNQNVLFLSLGVNLVYFFSLPV